METLLRSIIPSIVRFFTSLFGGSIGPRFTFNSNVQEVISPVSTVFKISNKRKLPCLLLFIGESGSGKSATISNIFNVPSPAKETTSNFNVWRLAKNTGISESEEENESISNDSIELELLDTPGLLGRNSVEQDAKILLSLSTLLRRESHSRLPTVTFLVARMDDNRFEGEQSNFSRVLKAYTQMRSYITDETCSNLVLLLTHSDRPEVQDNMSFIIYRYQDAFHKIFNVEQIPCIPVNRSIEFHHLIQRLSQIAMKKGRRDVLHALVNDVSMRKRFSSTGFTLRSLPVNGLVPPRRALTNRVMSKMLESEISTEARNIDSDSGDDADDNGDGRSEKFSFHFVPYEWLRFKGRKGYLPKFTCLPPESQIVLANDTCINVADCLIGDKVLSGRHQPRIGVVTNVTRVRAPNDIWLDDKSVGILYHKDNRSASTFVYVHQNGAFRMVNADQIQSDSGPYEVMYYLEVDNGKGTFVADGYVCTCHNMRSR